MNAHRSILGRLIAKDLYLYRWLILGTLITGVASLALLQWGDDEGAATELHLGFLLFLTVVIAFGCSLPMILLKEHQTKAQIFVLGLPVSPAQYSIARVTAALLAFLVPWTALTAGVVILTLSTAAPDGGLPFFVALMLFLLGNFCLLTAIAVISRSEIATIAGILVTNVSVTLFLVRLARLPGIAGRSREAEAIWSTQTLTVIAIELVVIALALALALSLPSRKKDFV